MPEQLPRVPKAFIRNSVEMSLQEIAYAVCNTLLGDEIEAWMLKEVVDNAFNFDIPLVQIGGGTAVLELFHGPTLAIKEIGRAHV